MRGWGRGGCEGVGVGVALPGDRLDVGSLPSGALEGPVHLDLLRALLVLQHRGWGRRRVTTTHILTAPHHHSPTPSQHPHPHHQYPHNPHPQPSLCTQHPSQPHTLTTLSLRSAPNTPSHPHNPQPSLCTQHPLTPSQPSATTLHPTPPHSPTPSQSFSLCSPTNTPSQPTPSHSHTHTTPHTVIQHPLTALLPHTPSQLHSLTPPHTSTPSLPLSRHPTLPVHNCKESIVICVCLAVLLRQDLTNLGGHHVWNDGQVVGRGKLWRGEVRR